MDLRAVNRPALPLPDRATLAELPGGAEGTRRTLERMRELVLAARIDPVIFNLSRQIVAAVPGKGYVAEATAIQNWVRRNIRYVRDVHGVETLTPPTWLLGLGQGDCDDQSMLVSALLESIGHPTQFVAVGHDPQEFSHVFVETFVNGRWHAVETTEPWRFGETRNLPPYRMEVPV